jgi:diaminohydroxyphosphoribosylaminopyrimidine deaminase/5-amino-6-(5-phosphoribosylamino)uracil reductase
MFTAADHQYMTRALQLAERGLFTTTPNPRVGCVIVRDNMVVGEGFHERAGESHAEIRALAAARGDAAGATVYVTLEPCSHHGRTPPCVDALIGAKVKRVIAAMRDPNPKVAGEGFGRLATAGVATAHGLLEDAARELNIGFVSRMTRGRPWLRMKIAATLDGKTAAADGRSQWITGEPARQDGHRWRARACAVLTGIGTVKDDDPRLSVRGVATSRQPPKVLVDSRLEVPLDARLFEDGNVLIATANDDAEKAAVLRARGAEIIALPNEQGKVALVDLVRELGRRELNEIHIEAGMKLNGSLVASGMVDELLVYLAPSLLGERGRGMFNLPPIERLDQRIRLEFRDVQSIGDDLRILARLVR